MDIIDCCPTTSAVAAGLNFPESLGRVLVSNPKALDLSIKSTEMAIIATIMYNHNGQLLFAGDEAGNINLFGECGQSRPQGSLTF